MTELKDQIQTLTDHLNNIQNHLTWSGFQKYKSYFELFTLILELATLKDRLNFTTLFSRLAFVGAKYQLGYQVMNYSHIFRKANEQGGVRQDNEELYVALGHYVCSKLLTDIFNCSLTDEDTTLKAEIISHFSKKKEKFIGFRQIVEAVLFEIDVTNKTLHFYDEDEPAIEQKALYDIHDRNELFNPNMESLHRTHKLPIQINLIDTDMRADGVYLPTAIIIQPDHMVDVTSVSECFKDYGVEPFLYLISKFKPLEATTALMTGHLVNLMLDKLIADPEVNFSSLLPTMFQSNPLGFAMLDDHETKDVIQKLKEHYKNLRYTISFEFAKFDIKRENIFLEPSFYSRDYGIQGRLDLLHQKENQPVYDIIELKSGKTFKPNVYGINASHYIQTLLYDLIIRSTFQTKAKSSNYILYSREENPLRFAPPVRAQQYEAMKVRNDILAIEQKLRMVDEDNTILTYIKKENFQKLKGFNITDINNFYNIYNTLSSLEKNYFNVYTAFIAREHNLSKTGENGINKSNGHAGLWLASPDEKKEKFSILAELKIEDNQSDKEEGSITFNRTLTGDTLVSFRVGDIGILYPTAAENQRSVLKNQIFKCTITKLTNEKVEVKLRSKQYNQSLFNTFQSWNIEQDNLDSSFNAMYKSLFTWASASFEFRSLILGLSKPKFSASENYISVDKLMTENQVQILNKILTAKDYFLLWGPPGSGKTSIMLKNLVCHLFENTNENILLLAYTNRAVDEICDAVISIREEYMNHFLRLGSRMSTGDKYKVNLLDQVIKQTQTRHEIIALLSSKRIFISTVSSIVNKTELFHLKNFDTVIIDEASQILEPMLTGLLSKFKRFILIGDHKQLPAVVVQDGETSKIKNENLNAAGIFNARTSLFERMYLQVIKNGWTDAYGILEEQGRMHHTLMTFPNEHFYENKLRLLPSSKRQHAPLFFEKSDEETSYLKKRKIFINSTEDLEVNWKTNKYEAEICIKVIEDLIKLYSLNNKELDAESIGIITPYRAQISLIKKYMENLPIEIAEKITVDTVERYQGGARDIIIISFCVNRLSQLESLVSLSQEGIDRKLNVALTRAKEHQILIGNETLLSKDSTYKALISSMA